MTNARPAEGLLALLQLADSGFPSGSFSQSYGIEQLIRDGRLSIPVEVEAFVGSVLRQCVATADAVAAHTAASASARGDLEAVIAVDRALYRTRAARELRNASLATGRRLAEEAGACDPEEPLLAGYRARLRADKTLGMHPVAFAVAGNALGVEVEMIGPALLLGAATIMLQAAMRLGRISHRDVQAALHRLRPETAYLAEAAASEAGPLRSFHPLQEIASMRHEIAEIRLFAS